MQLWVTVFVLCGVRGRWEQTGACEQETRAERHRRERSVWGARLDKANPSPQRVAASLQGWAGLRAGVGVGVGACHVVASRGRGASYSSHVK